jgi:dihydroxyacetone kinase
MNFGTAAGFAESEGIKVESVRASDDVASAPRDRSASRRGIAGIFFGYLVAAAAARRGWDLADVAEVTTRSLGRTRSMGVALAPSILPTVGEPNFTVPAGQMEIGMGIHGEPGVGVGPLRSADSIADDLVDRILEDLDPAGSSEVAVLVNGLGATPLEELYVLYRRVHQQLTSVGLHVRDRWVGEYATSLEMAGASVSVFALDDVSASLIDEGARLLRS